MKLVIGPEAKKDIISLDSKIRSCVDDAVRSLRDKPLPDNSYVIQLPDGTEIQCLKLQEQDRNSELNHRVTYDVEGKEVRIFGVFPRGSGYQNIKQKTQGRV